MSVQTRDRLHGQGPIRWQRLRHSVGIFLGAACCVVAPAYGDPTGGGGYANSPGPSETLSQPAGSSAYAPITLRSPSHTLSQHPARDESIDSQASDREQAYADAGEAANADTSRLPGGLAEGAPPRRSMTAPLVTIASSLALVLGLFGALVWVSRKAQRGRGIARPIPDEVLRVLGQKQLGSLGTISLIRCGGTVMIVSQSATGTHALATITDEAEVRQLEAACLGESAASFQAALGEVELEPVGRGFLGEGIAQPHARKRLFTQA